MSAGRKLMVGPSLLLHGGWQLVPLDSTRLYGPKKLFLIPSSTNNVTISTDCSSQFIVKTGIYLIIDMDGAAFAPIKGSELVTNGAFTATGGWTIASAWTQATGVGATGSIHHAAGATAAAFHQHPSFTVGSLYELKYSVVSHDGTGPLGVTLGGTTLSTDHYATGVHTECGKAASTGPLTFTPSTTGFHGVLDDISVKEVTGGQLLFAKGTAGDYLRVMFTI